MKKENYKKNLHQQLNASLRPKLAFSKSRKQDKINGTAKSNIYSANTFRTYKQQLQYFIRFVEASHPETTSLKYARKHAPEWLKSLENAGKSAPTIYTAASAINKLYGITENDEDFYKCPIRRREDITRSRLPVKTDAHFSEANNYDYVQSCKTIGARAGDWVHIKGKDLLTKSEIRKQIEEIEKSEHINFSHLRILKDAELFKEEYYVHVTKSKGGRERYSPLIGDYKDKLIERFKNTEPEQRVFLHVPSNADTHSYRAEYATRLYRLYAKDINNIPSRIKLDPGLEKNYEYGVYYCRRDEKGKKLDRHALLLVSKALGHNRISVVVDHYLRGL